MGELMRAKEELTWVESKMAQNVSMEVKEHRTSGAEAEHHSSPRKLTRNECKGEEPTSPNAMASTPYRRITRSLTRNAEESPLLVRQVSNARTSSSSSSSQSLGSTGEEAQQAMSRGDLRKHLCNAFPGRHAQIRELLCLIGGPRDFMPPLLVYGGPSCGKTSVILEIFKHLVRPYAYASCRSCYNPRLLFESILNQLMSHRRTKLNNYGSVKRCDKIADFVQYLGEACEEAIEKKYAKTIANGFRDSGVNDPAKGSMDWAEGVKDLGFMVSQNNGTEGFKGSHKDLANRLKGCLHRDSQKEERFKDSRCEDSPRKGFNKDGEKGSRDSTGKEVRGKSDSCEVVYLIFDNIELLHEWSNGFTLISALFKLSDLMRMPNLGLIFISNRAPDAFYSHTGALEPLTVYFRDYTDDELHQILLKGQPNPELYASFLNAILKPFSRASRRVTDLSAALQPLFKKYYEPIRRESVIPDEKGKRRLFAFLEPHIAPALNQIFNVSTSSGSSKAVGDKGRRKSITRRPGVDETAEDLDFHLSICCKYLLIAAFIASRNPATLDATLFDSTGGLDNQKRKRKSCASSMEKKENKVQEKLLKGPGCFPLERLLAIFQCITTVTDEDLENQQLVDVFGTKEGSVELMSDALMQLSTLCNINLLYKGSSCPLEGAARYRCNVDQELALRVARSVNFPLSKYLYR